MAAVAAPRLVDLDPSVAAGLARLGVLQGTGALLPSRPGLSLGWPELDRVLPDGALPRGVVELASPSDLSNARGAMRGGATTIAFAAAKAAHAADAQAWCAWVSPEGTPMPYAPAAAAAGVDLDRLLVVRPEPGALARTALKVAASGAFELVVVDAFNGLDGRLEISRKARARVSGAVVVRKLALVSEEKGTTFLLLTSSYTAREAAWPVALRLEVERRPDAIAIAVAKDRRGIRSSHHVVRVAS